MEPDRGAWHRLWQEQLQPIDGRYMERDRDDTPHQLQRTSCSMVGPSVLCLEPTECTYTSSDRQHNSSGLCEQNGWSTFQGPLSSSTTGLGLVSIQEPYDFSRASTRFFELPGRQGIENGLRLTGMVTSCTDLPNVDGDEGPMHSGSLCIPSFSQTPTYFSWRSDPGAKVVDVLTQSWNNIRGYAFPPFCLIGRCLAKIRSEKVPWVLLITPLWKSQTWFQRCQWNLQSYSQGTTIY